MFPHLRHRKIWLLTTSKPGMRLIPSMTSLHFGHIGSQIGRSREGNRSSMHAPRRSGVSTNVLSHRGVAPRSGSDGTKMPCPVPDIKPKLRAAPKIGPLPGSSRTDGVAGMARAIFGPWRAPERCPLQPNAQTSPNTGIRPERAPRR
jgi:hypothetical protein